MNDPYNLPSCNHSIIQVSPVSRFVWIFFAFTVLACNPDKQRKVASEQVKFTTSDASELFFRNVRQLYYDKTVMEEAKLDVYRIKERSEAESQPIVNLAIAVNWRFDEAYLLVEPNPFFQHIDTIQVIWQDTVRQEDGIFYFMNGNKEAHFEFASQLYNSLLGAQQLFIINNQERFPLLQNDDEREAFRKTMVDYYRLVDLF